MYASAERMNLQTKKRPFALMICAKLQREMEISKLALMNLNKKQYKYRFPLRPIKDTRICNTGITYTISDIPDQLVSLEQ